MTRAALSTLAMLAMLCTQARADARDWKRLAEELQGGAWAHYEVSDVHDTADDAHEAPMKLTDMTLAGLRIHGFVSRHRIGWHVGLDAAAGATFGTGHTGFAYDVAFLPVGLGLRWGDTQMIGIGTGVGAMGAVGTLDDAVTLPIEAFAELALGGQVRLLARARASYLAGADSRDRGSPTLGFADEIDGMLALRFGDSYHEFNFPSGNGYFVGAAYREMLGAKFVGVVLGYSIDLASPRRHRGGDSDSDSD